MRAHRVCAKIIDAGFLQIPKYLVRFAKINELTIILPLVQIGLL